MVGFPHRRDRVVGVFARPMRRWPAALQELPQPGPEVSAAEHRVKHKPDQNEVQRHTVELHAYRPSVVVGTAPSAGSPSGAAASRRRIHTTPTPTPPYTTTSAPAPTAM